MDNSKAKTPPSGGVSLGSGVDIIQHDTDIDDVEIESYNDDVLAVGEMTPKDHIKKLRDKLLRLEKEKQEYLDGWQRVQADFINYKKREDEGKKEFIRFAREELIIDILPVLESFHMAFANKEAWEKVDPAWRKGVEYIHTQLVQVLSDHGLKPVDPIGQMFNPNEESSVGTIATEDPQKYHTVAEVLQLGYRLNDKIVRPAKVKVYGETGDAT